MQPTFTTIQEARRWASLFLQKYRREIRVADLLLEDLLGWSQARLLAFETEDIPEEVKEDFIRGVYEHAETGVPVQHLIGKAHFYGREYKVNQYVLIPRPETEELVLEILNIVKRYNIQSPAIADIGTGSGVIAITARLEIPGSHVFATDLSEKALQVASFNAKALDADIQFRQGDFLEPIIEEPVDILVSNPPYISYDEKDKMDDTVVNFDPELALFAEEKGLAAYHKIISQLSTCGWNPYVIAFEIGYQQGNEVKGIIQSRLPNYQIRVHKDINGKDRTVFALHSSLT